MAIGVSTHRGALRISASSHAPPSSAVGWILSAYRRRRAVMDLPFSSCGGPFVASRRQGFYRLQRLTFHYYGTWNSHSMESQSTSLNHCTSTMVRRCIQRANEIPSSPSMFGIYSNSSDKGADNWSKDRWSSESLRLKIKKIQHSVSKGLGTGQISLMMKDYDSQCQVNNINRWETDSESYIPVLESEIECVSSNIHSNFDSMVVESQLQSEPSKSCSYSHQLEESLSDNQEVQINVVPESCNNINKKKKRSNKTSVNSLGVSKRTTKLVQTKEKDPIKEKLARVYDKVLVVDNLSTAKEVVQMLTSKYRNFIHACDTEVANIDVKLETPVGHGEVICFSIYSGEEADFGDGKSCIWVDVLDGGRSLLMEFVPFFEDPSIKKVWHNYSFDNHVLENYGIKLSGFHADTMHLARLWDSSRRADGGYSLEALTSDAKVMSGLKSRAKDISGVKSFPADELIIGKVSMKSIFGKRKLKKDGSEGKVITLAPLEVLQREERKLWICYSALDSISTKKLFNSLKQHLENVEWTLDGEKRGTMYDFYEEYWRPFGDLLVKMESEGMLVDRAYLKEMEKVAVAEQQAAASRFRKWAEAYCPDAKYMNVGSDVQIRQLFFGGTPNSKDHNEFLPERKTFKVLNSETTIDKEKKSPSKHRTIELKRIVENRLETDMYTDSGWPSICGDALKVLAGKVSANQECMEELAEESHVATPEDISIYGTAYNAFGGGKKGREACHAIAALCEICCIDSLISNFLLPLQGSHISCANGRVHCSLNINTETGRLSARRPSLQNQPALEKDRYKIRQAFIAKPGNSLIVADYGQLELRILAHLANCKSMLEAFRAGGDFHSRTAMNMYDHVRQAVEENRVLLEWHPQPGESEPPVPLLKNAFASERRKAKMLNFSIAYGKTIVGLSRDWKVSVKEARETVNRWYKERKEVRKWQEERKKDAKTKHSVQTLLGRSRHFPSMESAGISMRAHIERAAINTPVQGSAADVAMCAMLEIDRNAQLKELGWKLLLQVHDEVILEGPTESAELAKAIVVECMCKPFYGTNILRVDLSVDAKCAQSWYAAK